MNNNNIKQSLDFMGLKIIRRYPSDDDLMSYPRSKLNRNVEAYDQNGNLVWVIQECPDCLSSLIEATVPRLVLMSF